ncbi:hypothetical protein M441DRAFT_63418 [Trichoderma asperellum CBS 433.97]|uniref:AB hydrolase-1 domain-containing protein n=1 Tax=Trichoderma asperellum (strain ATCC 204424 / CBS 433.97 / NBRC 101777) TaxID=1042311 RepID=A0A2T3ZMT1_TRIA4|nr:hypothetical protein M441DRAFT_63418 [Trichoderma asperellum CBS 433.97]PTB46118.1 hypothetical protein M441DRAFT_63418 [Trichoderma asperellum CBS 433.97]
MFKPAVLLALATAVMARKCQNLNIPISISARNAVFNLPNPVSEIDVTNFALSLTRPGTDFPDSILTGYKTVSGKYSIAATYCQPDHGPGKALQILTHGVGFDRSYWDLSFNNFNYSYVAHAVDEQGYSTFTWDRLGIASSSKGDPVNEIQKSLEVAALQELSILLRQGSVRGISAKFDKFIHVGHSFGSAITYNFINANPDFSDAAILTGFSQSQNLDFATAFLLGGNFRPVKENPLLAAKYPIGYFAPQSSIGVNIQFFAPGDFDPKMLANAFNIGQAATPGELLTIASGAGDTNSFKGHLLIITGERDLPFCGGNCTDTTSIQGAFPDLLAPSKAFFPSAATFNTSIVPGAGHGLNLGYSHKTTYASMFDFLSSFY